VGWVDLWVHSFHFAMGWISRLVGWVGLKKFDPRTTLAHPRKAMGTPKPSSLLLQQLTVSVVMPLSDKSYSAI